MAYQNRDPEFLRAFAVVAAKRRPRYVRLLTKMLRRLPTDAELMKLFLSTDADAPPRPKRSAT
jgi:hypothetical protein